MRIGIDARFYSSSFTGIGRYVHELLDNLLKIDQKNHYTVFFNQPEFEKYSPPRRGVEKVLANATHYSFAEQWHFCKTLKRANLDIMHFTHFNAPVLYRKPSIVTIHDLTLSLYPGKKMAGFIERTAYNFVIRLIVRRAKKIIAVSQHTKKDLVNILHADPKKIEVIYEGISPHFHKIQNQNSVDEFKKRMNFNKPYLLYTGVWRSHKNLVNLIKAFAVLKHKYHFNGMLVITGKEDPWYPEVKQTVKDNRLEGDVRFTGLISDEELVFLYNAALVYVFPSLYEGFGLPALEAFACGIPVCAANASSLPEICGEGNAVFFNPHDPADIASKIASVYNDPATMEKLIKSGYQRVKNFSWQEMARKTLEIYHQAARLPFAL